MHKIHLEILFFMINPQFHDKNRPFGPIFIKYWSNLVKIELKWVKFKFHFMMPCREKIPHFALNLPKMGKFRPQISQNQVFLALNPQNILIFEDIL